jgi:urea transport system substrate-binding protein
LKTNSALARLRAGAIVLVAAAFMAACAGETKAPDAANEPAKGGGEKIKVGVLHSLTGTMAISEISLRDTVQMAIDEINAKGGVLGKQLEPVIVNPDSNWDLFADKARELISKEKVVVVFGCWTSASRKSVLPVFEELKGLLFYPVQYEGQEQSPNIFYTGATPNQQLIPAAEYMMSKEGGEKKKFYLLGTDYVFPRTANRVLKAFLLSKGVPEKNIVEKYTPFSHSDYQTIVKDIKDFGKAGDATVLSTINGDSNVAFYKEFANQKITAKDIPVMAFSVAEDELRAIPTTNLKGHLAAWNYYQSIDTPENKAFVEAFKKKFGADRVTDDPIEAAYFGVKVWAAAVEKAKSTDVDKVVPAVLGLEFDAPGGKKKMHAVNHHTFKPVYIGEILADGQFKIVSKFNNGDLVEPEAYSRFINAGKPEPEKKEEPKKDGKAAEPAKAPAKAPEPAKK